MAEQIAETNPIGYEIRRTGLGRVARAVTAHAAVLSDAVDPGPGDVYVVVEIADAEGIESVLISRVMAQHVIDTTTAAIREASRLIDELT